MARLMARENASVWAWRCVRKFTKTHTALRSVTRSGNAFHGPSRATHQGEADGVHHGILSAKHRSTMFVQCCCRPPWEHHMGTPRIRLTCQSKKRTSVVSYMESHRRFSAESCKDCGCQGRSLYKISGRQSQTKNGYTWLY